jgi:LmbE family N-acetylglucosaminyl deacetylase
MEEVRNASRLLGITDYEIWSFTDGYLEQEIPSIQKKLHDIFQAFLPTMVITHFPHDIHADHVALAKAVAVPSRSVSKVLYFKSP